MWRAILAIAAVFALLPILQTNHRQQLIFAAEETMHADLKLSSTRQKFRDLVNSVTRGEDA